VWGVDAEFISRPGERPDVLCVCGYEAWSGLRLPIE